MKNFAFFHRLSFLHLLRVEEEMLASLLSVLNRKNKCVFSSCLSFLHLLRVEEKMLASLISVLNRKNKCVSSS